MKKVTRIVLGSGLFLALALAGLAFWGYQKVNNTDFAQLTKELIESKYPETNVTIKELKINLGYNVHLNLKDFLWSNKNNQQPLINVSSGQVVLSWWNILFKSGNISLLLDKTNVYYGEAFNERWKFLNTAKEEPGTNSSSNNEYLTKLKDKISFDLRISDFNLFQKNETKPDIKISQFEINELKLNAKTNIDGKIAMNTETISFESVLSGFIDLSKIDKEIITGENKIVMNNIKYKNYNLNDVVTNIKWEKVAHVINAQISNSLYGITSEFSLKSEEEKSFIRNLKTKGDFIPLMKALNIDSHGIKSLPLTITGDVNYPMVKNEDINLKVTTESHTQIEYNQNMITLQKLSLEIHKFSTHYSMAMSLLDGSMNISGVASMNDNFDITDIASDISGSHLNLDKYIRTAEEAKTSTSSQGASKVKTEPWPITHNKISLKNISYQGFPFAMNGTINSLAQSASVKNLLLSFAKGSLGINSEIQNTNPMKTNNQINLDSFDIAQFHFLKNGIEKLTGTASGSIKGVIINDTNLKYDLTINSKITNGQIKGANFNEKLDKILAGLNKISSKLKPIVFQDSFKSLEIAAGATEKQLNLTLFNFLQNDGLSGIKGAGTVAMSGTGNPSNLEMVYTGKAFGLDSLPFLLTGKEYDLKPDIGYTLKKVSGSLAKAEIDKLKSQVQEKAQAEINKVKEKAQSEINKVQEKAQDQIKEKAGKLLKGLFD